jgi:signal transduction histidine kinase
MQNTKATPMSDKQVVVLLIDDQPVIGEAIKQMLDSEPDIAFHFCQNPSEAFRLAAELHPTVILQDLVMPEINGLDLVRYFRASSATRDVPLIVLSSKEEAETKVEAFGLGANDYLVKLPDPLELIARIRYHSNAYLNFRKHHEAKQILEQKNAQLEHLNQEKNEFLGVVAHDLKNPVAATKGLAELIMQEAANLPPEEIVLYAEKIRTSTERMFLLITNLLDVNALEAGKMNLHISAQELLPVVLAVIQDYTEAAEAKQIKLDFIGDMETKPALIDIESAIRVLDNIISNAIKYSPANTTVTVRLMDVDAQVRCEVRDQGPGLSSEDLSKMFGKFTRLSAKPTGGEHSTGLGLFIVKKLMEAMDGEVWCESELNEGTSFFVSFPQADR